MGQQLEEKNNENKNLIKKLNIIKSDLNAQIKKYLEKEKENNELFNEKEYSINKLNKTLNDLKNKNYTITSENNKLSEELNNLWKNFKNVEKGNISLTT